MQQELSLRVVAPSLGARIIVTGSEGVLMARQDGPNPAEDGVVHGGKSGDSGLQELPTPPGLTPFTDDRDPADTPKQETSP